MTTADNPMSTSEGQSGERLTEAEWRTLDDLRLYWHTFCDADVIPIDRDDFTDRLEAHGYITWRKVTKADVADTPFAYELGLEVGGMCWDLTDKGRKAIAPPSPSTSSDEDGR